MTLPTPPRPRHLLGRPDTASALLSALLLVPAMARAQGQQEVAPAPPAAPVAPAPPPATEAPADNDAAELRRELAELRQRVSDLESRAPQEPPADTATPAAPVPTDGPSATEPTPDRVHSTKDSQLPSYEGHRYDVVPREALPEAIRAFEFHGYMRSGVGFSSNGSDQEVFKAPGARSKYRLGNENDTYGELIFANDWFDKNSRKDPTGPGFKTQVRLGYSTTQSAPYTNNEDLWLLEAFGLIGDVIPGNPSTKFWAGERFYRRHDVHIIDFYYLDTSAYGGGMEDLDLKVGKLSIAYLGASLPMTADNVAGPYQHNVDTRLSEIAIGATRLTLWNLVSFVPRKQFPGESNTGDSLGVAFGAIHDTPLPWDGSNTAVAEYGIGPAASFKPSGIRDGGDDAWTLRFIDTVTIQPLPHVSGQAVVVYEERRTGTTALGNDLARVSWLSAGLRPVYHFTNSFGAQAEVGMDYTNDRASDAEGVLVKMTGALHVSPSAEFWSRPQVRAFVTHARWTKEFQGLVGGTAFDQQQAGTTTGLQVEAWW